MSTVWRGQFRKGAEGTEVDEENGFEVALLSGKPLPPFLRITRRMEYAVDGRQIVCVFVEDCVGKSPD
jgi:hypothetical protein